MLKLNATAQFKRDRRRCIKRGYDMSLLTDVVDRLLVPSPLPPVNKEHTLSGYWANHRECHIQPDWLLIYKVEDGELMLEPLNEAPDVASTLREEVYYTYVYWLLRQNSGLPVGHPPQ